MALHFPEGFLFGAASAAYQIEGGWNLDNRGLSIWDYMTHTAYPEMENGDDACKSYPDKYIEDVKLLKDAGFQTYRFSISWTRILPNGELTTANINQKGVEYYRKLIKELKKNGIEPMVTIYHWDLPHCLQEDFGGWTNSLIVDYMHDYADLLFSLFGDEVKWWITINEPTLILHGYENGAEMQMAPAKSLYTPGNYIVIHNMLKAHARIYHLYDKNYRSTQKGKVGISLVGTCYRPKNPENEEDVLAAKKAYEFYLGLFAHPIYTKEGDYPKLVRDIVDENSIKKEGRKRSRLPTFTIEEKESLKGSSDFFGMNHYLTELCTPSTGPVTNVMQSFREDIMVSNEALNQEASGFRELLKYVKNTYGDPEIFITENGLGVKIDKAKGTDPKTLDFERVDYFKKFLTQLLKAIHEDGCNVIAYTVWSLMDNFEWSRGYDWKYGITHVDFEDEDRKRTPKKSYEFFKQLIKDRYLEPVE